LFLAEDESLQEVNEEDDGSGDEALKAANNVSIDLQ
jgi:hypothetical protein